MAIGSQIRAFSTMSLLRHFSLFLIATVLGFFHSKQVPFGLAVEIDWKLGRNPDVHDGNPLASDYPDDDEIAEAWTDPGKDKFAIWADIEDTDENALNIYRYTLEFKRYTIWDCYPRVASGHHFLERENPNWRSLSWYGDFYRRAMRYALLQAKGIVHLISQPEGPQPDCTDWHEFFFLQLQNVEAVERIDLYSIYTLKFIRRYWPEDPDNQENPDKPDSGGSGGGDGNIIGGGEGRGGRSGNGNNINGGGGDGNGNINNMLVPGTAILGGSGFGAAVIEGILPAAGTTGISDANSLLNGLKGSASTTLSPDWTDVIEHPNHLGDGWQANIPAGSFDSQARVLPDDPSNPFDISQDSGVRSRGLRDSCSLGSEWKKLAEIPWIAPPRSSNGGPTFRVGLGALFPPGGELYDHFIKPIFGGAGNVLTVTVIQTRLHKTPEAEAGVCHLDVTIRGGLNNGIIASGIDDVNDSLEFRVEIPSLQTALFLWWTGSTARGPQDSDPIHFRSGGDAGQPWDSTDTSKCQTSLYVDDKRVVSCQYTSDIQ